MEKFAFFWADMAGLGKYRTGRYGRIGVYGVNSLLVLVDQPTPEI